MKKPKHDKSLDRYYEATDLASSVEPAETGVVSVEPGSNEGYYITAHGRRYRFPTVERPSDVADLVSAIVSVGPLLDHAIGEPKMSEPRKRRRSR